MDNRERTALINAAIPKEHQKHFYNIIRQNRLKVRQGPSSGPFSRSKPNRALQPSLLASCISVFKGMLDWDDYHDVSPERFIAAARMLNYDKRYNDSYLSLTPVAQRFFVKLPKSSTQNRNSVFIYLTMLERLDDAVPNYSITHSRFRTPGSFNPESVLSFSELLMAVVEEVEKNSSISTVGELYDLKLPSPQLATLMKDRTPPAFNDLDFILMDVLFMWKMIYGENTVLEFYEKFREYPRPLSGQQMFTILDDWENLQHYPTAWIMSVK